ncbi:MAG: DUF2917 domain-containing protein [Rubrivivax sp.]
MATRLIMQKSHHSAPPTAAWRLAGGQARRLGPAAQGRWLSAAGGRLWLTRSGGGAAREADVFLDDGAAQWLPAHTEWVIEAAWGDAAFLLLVPPPLATAA